MRQNFSLALLCAALAAAFAVTPALRAGSAKVKQKPGATAGPIPTGGFALPFWSDLTWGTPDKRED
jgi:hypothetical protein